MKKNYKIPVKLYYNAEVLKSIIYKNNRNKSGIYRWVDNIHNYSYIGSSINLTNRFMVYYSKKSMLNHLSTRKSYIYDAILIYGHNNFSLEILEYCEKESLTNREQYYIDLLEPEYNISKRANLRYFAF